MLNYLSDSIGTIVLRNSHEKQLTECIVSIELIASFRLMFFTVICILMCFLSIFEFDIWCLNLGVIGLLN